MIRSVSDSSSSTTTTTTCQVSCKRRAQIYRSPATANSTVRSHFPWATLCCCWRYFHPHNSQVASLFKKRNNRCRQRWSTFGHSFLGANWIISTHIFSLVLIFFSFLFFKSREFLTVNSRGFVKLCRKRCDWMPTTVFSQQVSSVIT